MNKDIIIYREKYEGKFQLHSSNEKILEAQQNINNNMAAANEDDVVMIFLETDLYVQKNWDKQFETVLLKKIHSTERCRISTFQDYLQAEPSQHTRLKTISEIYYQFFLPNEESVNLFFSSFSFKNLSTLYLDMSSTKLGYQFIYIGVKGAQQLGLGLMKFLNLQFLHINLNNNQIEDEGVLNLMNGVQELKLLDSLQLNLRGNWIMSEGANNIGQGLSKLTFLRILILVTDFCLPKQKFCQESGTLKGIGEQLYQGIGILKDLRYLDIQMELIQSKDEACNIIFDDLKSLRNLDVLQLVIEWHQIGTVNARILMYGLIQMRSIKYLKLVFISESVHTFGAQEIGEGIMSLNKLEILNLDFKDSKFGRDGIQWIAQGLSGCLLLQDLSLNFERNEIGQQVTNKLMSVISQMSDLQSLYLNFQKNELKGHLDDEIAIGIFSLSQLRSLYLNLAHSCFNNENILILTKVLQSLQQLQTLTLDFSQTQLTTQSLKWLGNLMKIQSLESIELILIRNNYILPEDLYDLSKQIYKNYSLKNIVCQAEFKFIQNLKVRDYQTLRHHINIKIIEFRQQSTNQNFQVLNKIFNKKKKH